MISPSFTKELLDRVDIFDVINRRVPLKLKGSKGWACCPFHNEKTSSFSVDRPKQFFYCFGCKESGDAITFLMKYEGLPYPDAVEKLAAEYGIPVKYEQGSKNTKRSSPRLTEIMLKVQHYYQLKLKDNPAAEKYIEDRGLTAQTIQKFGLGFAPDSWRYLSAAFPDISSKLLIEVGLQREGQNGKEPFDFFRNRLMFPIRNMKGQTIAFSARTMTGEEPKYINTGETPIFSKGQEAFGLYEALKAIRDKKRVIVVEGQMDVIQMSQAGFEETCAPLGTAIRSDHIQKLLKLADNIIFSFDGDTAGHKAARKAMELCLPLLGEQQKASFVFLPDGEDPDSYIKKFGAKAFEKFLTEAKPLSEYFVSSISEGLDIKIAEDKSVFISRAKELLKTVSNPIFRSVLMTQVARAANMSDTRVLEKELNLSSGSDQRQGEYGRVALRDRPKRLAPGEENLLRTLLRDFLFYPHLMLNFEHSLDEYLASVDSSYAKAISKTLSVVFAETESGESIREEISRVRDLAKKEFDEKIERLRALLINTMSSEKEVDLCKTELGKIRELETKLEAASLEVRMIFMKIELGRLKDEKAQFSRDNSKEKLRQVLRRISDLTVEYKRLDRELQALNKNI